MQSLVIAIDGPSGSGKSSTARLVASRLGLAYLDTGSMYRAVALGCMGGGLLPAKRGHKPDRDGIVGFAMRAELTLRTDPDDPGIALNGIDVTDDIRSPEVSAHVSTVAVIPEVRAILTAQMRAIVAEKKRIVAEGRDITTVVCPDADVRVLLVADVKERMTRREAQVGGLTNAELRDQVVRRDRDDSTVSQFEAPAPGVELIDSTYMTLEEVADAVIALVPVG